MPKKLLLPIIVLLGILNLFLFINHQAIYSEYIKLKNGNERLETENKELARKFSESQEERKRLFEKMEAIRRDLDNISKERDEYKRKFEITSKEKEELTEKLKAAPRIVSPPREITPPKEDAYWAAVLKEKASLELQVSSLKDEISQLKSSLKNSEKEKANLELELKDLQNKILDLERQIKYNEQLASNLSVELVREKEDKRALSEQIRLVREENTLLKRQLNQTEEQRQKLEENLKETEGERLTLSRRLTEIEKILEEKMTELIEVKEGIKKIATQAKEILPEETKQVELPPIVVRPQELSTPIISVPSVKGEIIAVNREHNFIIIDLGQEHGIKPGRTFEVFRDDRPIGILEAIQVRSSVSACDIKSKSTDLKTGDVVR